MPDTHTETASETRPFARRAIREELNRELSSRGQPTVDDEEELNEEEEEEIATGNQVDVFDFCHKLIENGDVIEYQISKNSQFVATKAHPYSWLKVQSDFGEGHYRIIAKSQLTKRILKQQTQFVSAKPVEEKSTAASIGDAVRSAMPPQQDTFEQMAKVAALLKSLTPPPPPAVEDKSSNVMMTFMQSMMQMQQQSQQQFMTMMGEMQKSNREMVEKISQSQQMALDKIETKMSANAPKEKLDPIMLLKLVQDAEKRGFENMRMLDELADKKASRMGHGGDDEDKEPKSAMERLASAVLPAVAAGLAKGASTPPQNQGVVAPRRVVPQRPMPQFPQTTAAKPQPQPQPGQARPAPTPVVLPKLTKDQAIEKLAPFVFPKLMEADNVKTDSAAVARTQAEAAQAVKVEMAKFGLTVPALLQLVGQGDIIDVATAANLPLEAHTWLKGFYADLTKLGASGTVTQPAGQPAPGGANPANP